MAMTFKEAVRYLAKKANEGGLNSAMPYSNGLCYNLSCLTSDQHSESYHLMNVLLSEDAYLNGLGQDRVFTARRIQFLEYLQELTYPQYLRMYADRMELNKLNCPHLVSPKFFGE